MRTPKNLIDTIIKLTETANEAGLSRYLETSKTSIKNWRDGKSMFPIAHAVQISERFGKSLDWLYYGESVPPAEIQEAPPSSMAPKALEAGKEAHGISQELLNVRIERQLAAMSARMEAYEKKPTQEKAHIAEKCTELELFLNGNVPEMTLMDVILFLQGQLKKCFRCIYVEECLSLAHMQKLLEILYQSCERAIQKQKQSEQGKRELEVLLADAHEKIRRLEAQIQKKTKPPVSILPFSHQKTRSKDSENPMFFGDPEGVALMAAMMPCTPTLLCNKTGAAGVVVSEYTDAIETKTPEKGLRRCLICGGKLDTGELVFDAPASAFADGRYLNSDIQIHQTCADYNPDIAIGFVSNMLRILKSCDSNIKAHP